MMTHSSFSFRQGIDFWHSYKLFGESDEEASKLCGLLKKHAASEQVEEQEILRDLESLNGLEKTAGLSNANIQKCKELLKKIEEKKKQ